MIRIEQRDSGEFVWRCSLPHGDSGRTTGGNQWEGRASVNAAVRRHYTKHHPHLRAGRELRNAWVDLDSPPPPWRTER